ncbi:putative TLC domain containing protein [Blattamonas nauphoetae]|uniref:TLC domain containing protein n=1 Tax=Blattamonas nauphoetae TaxID=2049346 RepID=A0ABQ9XEY2_9EUKA|nr:putative TLC domain containing protein [Blattamonas nauphoetae]
MTDVPWKRIPILFLIGIIAAIFRLQAELVISNGLYHWHYFRTRRTRRFVRETFSFLYLAIVVVYEFMLMYQEKLFNLANCWTDFLTWQASRGFNNIYFIEACTYIQALIYTLMSAYNKRDIIQHSTHHIVTLLLLGLSYKLDCERIGLVVLLCHNASEIFVVLGKAFLYLGHFWPAIVALTFTIITWFAFRIIYFPFFIIRSTLITSYPDIDRYSFPFPGYFTTNFLLLCILVLNIHGLISLVRLYIRLMKNGIMVKQDMEDSKDRDPNDPPKTVTISSNDPPTAQNSSATSSKAYFLPSLAPAFTDRAKED